MTPDIPSAAYHNTTRALDEFDAVATMYDALLNTQRALLRAENPIAAGHLSGRGDVYARQVVAYGQQIGAMRAAMNDARYDGFNARALRRRFALAERRVHDLATSANQLATLCLARRNIAAAALERDRGPAGRSQAREGYGIPRRGLIIDTSW